MRSAGRAEKGSLGASSAPGADVEQEPRRAPWTGNGQQRKLGTMDAHKREAQEPEASPAPSPETMPGLDPS
ncbi:MAG: hypothetical protein QF411_07280, partial [Planctomycetota bacterium]|nr:hypothetical protein [Planctomycetota bacterium]